MTRLLISLLVSLTALSGCDPRPGNQAGPKTTPSGTPTQVTVPALTWASLPEKPEELSGDLTVGSCGGDAPLVCFYRRGEVLGSIELGEFQADTFDDLRFTEAMKAGDMPAARRAMVERYLEDLRKDRDAGCGEGYRFEPSPVEDATVLGTEGLRFGFTGGRNDKIEERHLNHLAMIEGVVYFVNAPAYEPSSCGFDEELEEFDVAGLEEVGDLIGPLVAKSRLR